jgi:NO-binding membrane sensor protein with MHYT domain
MAVKVGEKKKRKDYIQYQPVGLKAGTVVAVVVAVAALKTRATLRRGGKSREKVQRHGNQEGYMEKQ